MVRLTAPPHGLKLLATVCGLKLLATVCSLEAFMYQRLKYASQPKFNSNKCMYIYCVYVCMSSRPPCRLTEHLRVEERSELLASQPKHARLQARQVLGTHCPWKTTLKNKKHRCVSLEYRAKSVQWQSFKGGLLRAGTSVGQIGHWVYDLRPDHFL